MNVAVAATPWLDLRAPAQAVARRDLRTLAAPKSLAGAVIATWRGRMVNEHGSARVFEGLAAQMVAAGLESEGAQARTFAREERDHGILCGAVVEALGGAASAPALPHVAFPSHEDARTPAVAVLRNAMSIGCLSETVAVALIGAERLEIGHGPLFDLITRIWSDEVGHARFAWRLLASAIPKVSSEDLSDLSDYLAVAFAHLEAHELSHLPIESDPGSGGEAFGLCRGDDARALFYDTVTEVIVPGLSRLGLDASTAWERRSANPRVGVESYVRA